MSSFIHPSAEVSPQAIIGPDTKIWALSQVRDYARIGSNCNIGRNVFVDTDVTVGNNCKVQNNALLYEGVELEDGVFIGPAVCFTNDRFPRAVNPEGNLKDRDEWVLGRTLIKYGASVGAQSVIVTGVTLGRFCLVGSGSVVTKNVPDFALVVGQPARIVGYVCRCAQRLQSSLTLVDEYDCPACGRQYRFEGNTLIELMMVHF